MLIGPVAVGKSFIIEHVTAQDKEFNSVPTFTTRDARSDDTPGLFLIRPHTVHGLAQILDEIQQGRLVQYMVHPTTHSVYGTKPEYYSARYNLLPTISTVVDTIHRPFGSGVAVFIVAKPETWRKWLDIRYPIKSKERTKRLQEAVASLRWALANEKKSNIMWVENSIATPEKTIDDIINIVKYSQKSDEAARIYAEQMLALAVKESEE
jgi:guanylate kinase